MPEPDDWTFTHANAAYSELLMHVKREHSTCVECEQLRCAHSTDMGADIKRRARAALDGAAEDRRKESWNLYRETADDGTVVTSIEPVTND